MKNYKTVFLKYYLNKESKKEGDVMLDMQHAYAVARIRSRELGLLQEQDIESLLASDSYEGSLKILVDKGWGETGDEPYEEILQIERKKMWQLMDELVDDLSVFDTFLYEKDFHNLKAAIKRTYINKEIPNIYLEKGTVDVDIIVKAVENNDFTLLPDFMRSSAKEAYDVQLTTGDSQLCDVILDHAALTVIYEKAKESKNDVLIEYGEMKIVFANINIAIRSFRTGKDEVFMNRAMVECDSLDKNQLIKAAVEGEEKIYEYLENTVYKDAVKALKTSSSEFERYFDNVIINHIKPQKYNSFTLAPLAAYILARENEIKTVRIILSGKRNNIPNVSIEERVREMYV